MTRSGNRGFIPCQAVLYTNKDEIKDGYIKPASRLNMTRLKARLCDAGPTRCPKCMLCEYGKEYVKRSQHHEENKGHA